MFVTELPFKPVEGGLDYMSFSCHCDARSFGVQSDNTKSEQAYLLIKQSLVVIFTDIQRLFE